MAVEDLWRRALIYFGLGDEEYEEDYEEHEDEYRYPEPGPTVRRVDRPFEQPAGNVARLAPVSDGRPEVFVINPKRFEDATRIADKFRENAPVVMNLSGAPADAGRRIMDFVSGMTYVLGGSMQRVGEGVFLLTPGNVQVTAEEKRRWHEKGYF